MSSSGSSPGEFPYRRGITSESYEQNPWIIGQYSGYSSPSETNARFKQMIAAGQQGLAVALDLPTQHGLDPDDELSRGEVGRVGVSLATVEDFADLFDGIPFDSVRQVSTTANAIAPMFVALVMALAERRGEDPSDFSLRMQNDVLKEYVARGTQIFPAAAGAKLSVDVVEYCSEHFPHWVPMCVSGYHMRDAGATREQEVGFTLANSRAYLDLARQRSVDIARFAGSISWFMSASTEFLNEAAKFRASRQLWAEMLSDTYGIKGDDAAKLRIFAYTLGGELSPFEIMNNAPRVTLSALGAVLGGVQALFCSSIDEAVALPSDAHARLSVRTQQIILQEAGIASLVDPLGGAESVERETDMIVEEAGRLAAQVGDRGGSVAAIEDGWMRQEIDEAAWDQELSRRASTRVGEPETEDEARLQATPSEGLFKLDPAAETERVEEFTAWKDRRSKLEVQEAQQRLHLAITGDSNVVEPILNAFRADLTIGEVTQTLLATHGAWNETRARTSAVSKRSGGQ